MPPCLDWLVIRMDRSPGDSHGGLVGRLGITSFVDVLTVCPAFVIIAQEARDRQSPELNAASP